MSKKTTKKNLSKIKPTITRTDLRRIFDTLLSDKLTVSVGGAQLRHFEKKFSLYHGTKDALMYANDSIALYAILKDLDIKQGDEILISSFAEPFLVETILYLGAKPVFIDCVPGHILMDLEKAKNHMTKQVRLLIYSYPFGYGDSAALRLWMEKECNCPVVEDVTQALGCRYVLSEESLPVGTVGDYALFSLAPSRLLTSAKGAVVLAKDHERISSLSCARGVEGDRIRFRDNFLPRLDFVPTELEAALALSQFSVLSKNLQRRKEITENLKKSISEKGKIFLLAPPDNFLTNDFFHLLLFPTYQDKLDAKASFEQTKINCIEEVDELAYAKYLASQGEAMEENLSCTLDVFSKLLVLSFPLDVDDRVIKKTASLLTSLGQMNKN